jgi:hypothetical protein
MIEVIKTSYSKKHIENKIIKKIVLQNVKRIKIERKIGFLHSLNELRSYYTIIRMSSYFLICRYVICHIVGLVDWINR